jgi:hypothetical protein
MRLSHVLGRIEMHDEFIVILRLQAQKRTTHSRADPRLPRTASVKSFLPQFHIQVEDNLVGIKKRPSFDTRCGFFGPTSTIWPVSQVQNRQFSIFGGPTTINFTGLIFSSEPPLSSPHPHPLHVFWTRLRKLSQSTPPLDL